MEKKNIYQKLAEARNALRLRNIKPTGKNQGRFTYYELEDILPHVTEICEKIGLLPIMNYYADRAVLTIYDTESDAYNPITLESPMSTAKLAGCHEVQNLGAVETYEKRYLYMHAFDIAESDILDGTVHTEEKPRARISSEKTNKSAPAQKAPEAPKPQQKAPADIAEYLLQKGFDPKECAKAGSMWEEAKEVLADIDLNERKSVFKTISTNEELIDWNRGLFWKLDAAHKLQDAQIEGNNEPEFVDDSPTLYDNEEEK